MKGAIFFSTKYGSTEQYANWINEASGLPAFNVKDYKANLKDYDFYILGSPVIYYKLTIRKWVKKHLSIFENKPVIFFSVSGAPAGDQLDEWITSSLPKDFKLKMTHVVLRGRQIPENLTFFDKVMMQIGGFFNKDPEARKEEMKGFDFMDKSSIKPILEKVEQLKQGQFT